MLSPDKAKHPFIVLSNRQESKILPACNMRHTQRQVRISVFLRLSFRHNSTSFVPINCACGVSANEKNSSWNKLAPYRNFHHFFALAVYRNCGEIYKSGERKDGAYLIKPDNLPAFDVFCDQTANGGGWTVFQKRLDGSVDFFLNWSDYKVGFGDLNGEFWLGLDKIHRLTSDNNSMLRVDLEDFEGNTTFAEYNKFGVMSENDKYKLILGSYSGDSLLFSFATLFQVTIL